MQPRTRRQREVLDYISAFIAERGYEPSYQQIARHFHIASKSAIAKHIAALEVQGLLSRQRENGSFGLRIRPNEEVADAVSEVEWFRSPDSVSTTDDWETEALLVPQILLGSIMPDRLVAFRVPTESLVGDQIREGDIVLIEKRNYARDGDNVLCLIDEKTPELKKYFRDGADIELRSADGTNGSMRVSADRVMIQGVVRGLLRPLS